MLHSPESLLQLLQSFPKPPNQIKQIHSLLITKGHLLCSSNITASNSKWMSTLLYNALQRAYLSLGQARNTLVLFTHMLAHQSPPNSHTFPSLIKAAATCLPSLGKPLHTQVVKRGVLRDPFIQTSFVSFYAHLGELFDARKMFEEISQPCIVAYNAMLDAFGKNGDMRSALLLFDCMPERDVVSWTSVIDGFGRNGCFHEAVKFFEKMMVHEDVMSCSLKPNEATYVSVLSSCANLDGGGSLYRGKQIHGYAIRNEIELTVFTQTALIDLYGKKGCLRDAVNVFDQMVFKEVCTWNAMMSSLASNGREMDALDAFEKMKVEGQHPNEVTFVAVLTACARGKLVELGLKLFKSMLHESGIVPSMEHYGCIVDLLGRAGLLKEATDIISSMPFEPDGSVLGALFGACKIHGAIELANIVGQRLLDLQPRHCGRYVTLSNVNAVMEKWDHAADLRKAMVEAGIQKVPAYSLIDSI
ncbi:putative pentatricopeptide repeat-containing protein At1g10330 [Juglans microcarpa x Juglans regia]|uniref:putative pentatricopeptide repeat-containing protein At1g10330 n=1 Tax=Juglans microcarpa x Juglans regia TaxID=2249226 RepID=UPI001B7E90F9|nr:putative pentatricopeptide repeat-containing protein At1g10330 [Juglans microcarpa x Juglans regia]